MIAMKQKLIDERIRHINETPSSFILSGTESTRILWQLHIWVCNASFVVGDRIAELSAISKQARRIPFRASGSSAHAQI